MIIFILILINIYIQVVKKLLKCMTLDRNIQNNNDMTALDVLRANGSPMSKDTEKIIQKSGGKTRCCLSKVEKMSEFLRKPVTFREYCKTKLIRYRSHVTDGSRNALLVITALIITATYEAEGRIYLACNHSRRSNDMGIQYNSLYRISRVDIYTLTSW